MFVCMFKRVSQMQQLRVGCTHEFLWLSEPCAVCYVSATGGWILRRRGLGSQRQERWQGWQRKQGRQGVLLFSHVCVCSAAAK